ncbi:MAG: AbrB/MazE/SpoVT family DNA-binding domain-containing protein [Bdellovibrionales bacterium]
MDILTVTQKGQVTIPVKIRKALGIFPGDKATFRMNQSGQYVIDKFDYHAPSPLSNAMDSFAREWSSKGDDEAFDYLQKYIDPVTGEPVDV